MRACEWCGEELQPPKRKYHDHCAAEVKRAYDRAYMAWRRRDPAFRARERESGREQHAAWFREARRDPIKGERIRAYYRELRRAERSTAKA